VNNQIVTLVPLAALSVNVFLWRHADHDIGIIDAASYLEQRLRPAIMNSLAPGQYLGYETFLSERRQGRSRHASRLVSLGNENTTMFLLLAIFLAAGWCILITTPSGAGNAHGVFDALLILASVLTVFSLVISLVVGADYKRIVPSSLPATPPSVSAATPATVSDGTDHPPTPESAETGGESTQGPIFDPPPAP
jgi:hypothetical protein